MKKLTILLITVIISLTALGIDVETVGDVYKTLIQTYNEGENISNEEFYLFFQELNNLGLYRFYRTQMIGSAEYIDRPTNVQTYLSQIYDNVQSQFTTIEEKLALAGFLVYVQSDLSGEQITQEMIRSLPAYFKTVQEYTRSLENDALTYFGNVIIYSLGIVDSAPFTNIERFPSNAQILDKRFYIYEGETNPEFDAIILENKQSLEQGIQQLAQSGLTGRPLQIAIDQLSYNYVNSLINETRDQLQQVTQIFIEEGKAGVNIAFIRIIIYAVLILITFLFLRKYLWVTVLSVFGVEFVYLLVFYNPITDTISSFLYGSYIVTFVFLFLAVLLFKSFGKKIKLTEKVINFSIFFLVLITLFVPSYYSYDLLMEKNNQFNNSAFETQLLNDVVVYPHAPIHKTISSLNSHLGSEYSQVNTFYRSIFGSFLGDLLNSQVLSQIQGSSVQTNREGLKIDKVENYRGIPLDFSNEITDFVNSSEISERNIYNELDTLKVQAHDVLKFSDAEFESKFIDASNQLLSSSDLIDPLLPSVNSYFNVDKVNKINLRTYNTIYGTKVFLLFFLSLTIFVIFEEKFTKYISLLSMLLVSILSFIKVTPLEVFSQIGYPTVLTVDYSFNYIFGIILLVLTSLLFVRYFYDLKNK
ncbi:MULTISPECIES: hypothetical protein [Petrotoga]|uniref:Uncharacterized protein n=4 Tax=Petrotoga TaxID=28236 RepID=A0A4R8F3J3_9BACT|nr:MULTISPECIES: hypothetical protein [Petrotoga]KUK15583.1 MAG: Uncharacterized protein XD53_0990 [Petrotoga mobilis]PNR95565.1 hypothetical protein X929_07465 [Petrotoga olearia DSM 13574]POZ88032.1 hypothetical protein AA80_08135 [Petrotoga sibirica DSM 13575]RMA72631.1 hypothetical protein C8D75_1295 [Petrotoga olearia]TDX17127.1 hypothetical protein C8D74_10271 [Petrotoga sibirica]